MPICFPSNLLQTKQVVTTMGCCHLVFSRLVGRDRLMGDPFIPVKLFFNYVPRADTQGITRTLPTNIEPSIK